MGFNTIAFDNTNGIATIRLNRPDSLNSFTSEMHQELREAMDIVEADESVRCLMITGTGRGFCAGQDLSERDPGAATKMDLGASHDTNYKPLIRRLKNLPIPVVGVVNGVAAGAGASLALACDLVLAARSARFIQAFCKIGLIPDAGGTWALPRLVGHARALGLAMLGDSVSAEQAEALGMIWRCIDDSELADEAAKLCERLAVQPTRGLGLIKKAINASMSNDLDAQLDLERDLQREAGLTEDFDEGVAAFQQKRPPVFKGR
jgi:2-(1,2-epoxy-1,2-dihydrophenyl)acetyl-CoA isomerase